MLSNAELRERILAYLIFVLPEGRQDPKLMDYGLRASFGGRRSKVEVVCEKEVSTQETEVEIEALEEAPSQKRGYDTLRPCFVISSSSQHIVPGACAT